MDTKFSIALHILAYITETDKTVTSEILAKSVGTNASHIRKIITMLKDADILDSQQGKRGITLKADPEKLPLDTVYQAVYPNKALLHIHETANEACPVGACIREALLPIFEESENSLINSLHQKKLRGLIENMYEINECRKKNTEERKR